MNNILDDYALISPLRHRNNWLKLAIVFFGLIVGVSCTSPITPVFIALCMSFTTIVFGRMSPRFYSKLLLAPMGFAAAGILIICLLYTSKIDVCTMSLDLTFFFKIVSYNVCLLYTSRGALQNLILSHILYQSMKLLKFCN